MARYRGNVTYPLFIAPYELPASLQADFVGVPCQFDKASIHPIIQCAFTSDGSGHYYWNAVVPQPFDFGQTFIDTLGGPSGGVFPFFAFDPLSGPASFIASVKDGNGAEDIDASGKILGTGQPYMGGNLGEYNVSPPLQVIDARPNNGITDQGYNGPFYWNSQSGLSGSQVVWSPLGACNIYNCYNADYSMYWAEGQEPLVLANWAGQIGSIGFPFAASSEAVYFPGSADYPSGRYYPWVAEPLPGGGLEPGGGGAVPIVIELDKHSALTAYFHDQNYFQADDYFLVFVVPVRFSAGQAFTVILLDTRKDEYYTLSFDARTGKAAQALNDITGGIPSIKRDPNGVWYLLSTVGSLKPNVFHTKGLVLDYYPITLEPPPPFVLPCFNPCVPYAVSPVSRKPIP